MSEAAPFRVPVRKHYRFSPETVFDAWLDADLARQWFAPDLGEMVRADIDGRADGSFRLDQQRGEERACHWGHYHQVERPHRLVFTWCAGNEDEAERGEDDGSSVVTLDFTADPAGCTVTLMHELDRQWSDYEEQIRWGWKTMLDGVHDSLNATETPGTRAAIDMVRFERLLPASPQHVWAWLTEADRRAAWLAGGELPVREGELFALHFEHARLSADEEPVPERFRDMADGHSSSHVLLRFEPPHLLQCSWGEEDGARPSEATFELTEEDGQTRLTVTHTLLERDAIARVAAGWHSHLAVLADRLAGVPPRPFWRLFGAVEPDYMERFFSE